MMQRSKVIFKHILKKKTQHLKGINLKTFLIKDIDREKLNIEQISTKNELYHITKVSVK